MIAALIIALSDDYRSTHRLEQTFGKGSLPSDAEVGKGIKTATMRKKWEQKQKYRVHGGMREVSSPPAKGGLLEAARDRASRPVAGDIRRKLTATKLVKREMEALTSSAR